MAEHTQESNIVQSSHPKPEPVFSRDENRIARNKGVKMKKTMHGISMSATLVSADRSCILIALTYKMMRCGFPGIPLH